MTTLLPIFPLGMVAFPGMTVPLHIFEDRYRLLVRDLMSRSDPADRTFCVVAIREGYEIGGHESHSMYRTGCVVQLMTVEEYDDGRFDIAAVGRHRVRVLDTDTSAAYLQAQVETMDDTDRPSEDTARAAAHTLATFGDYREKVSELRGDDVMTGTLPRDPELLSYVLAATCSLTLRERQQLLESPSTLDRLDVVRRMMRREVQAMSAIPSLPATEVARSGWNPN